MFVLEAFDKTRHERGVFICNNAVLTDYLQKYANQDLNRDLAKIYVAVKNEFETNNKKIIYGYFTLSAYSLHYSDLLVHKYFGKYKQVPAILIGRLAVQKEQTVLRGYELLGRALRACKKVSEKIGVQMIVVDVIDDHAIHFYLRQGFIQLKSSPAKLYFPIRAIK